MPNPIETNNSSITINKAPPFLELSKDTIQKLGTSDLDIENVLSVWTGLTKCSGFIKDGKRLENMSWRIVNRNLINHHQNQNSKDTEAVKSPGNKLKDSDFLSLLAILADQNLLLRNNQQSQQRPQLPKKKSSKQNLSKRVSLSNELLEKQQASNNNSTQNINHLRPSLFPKKASSSKPLHAQQPQKPSLHEQQQNLIYQSKRSEFDLATLERNADLYDQPNPKYAFGIYDHPSKNNSPDNDNAFNNDLSNDQHKSPPVLARTDTSTSIVRGFSPNQISVRKHNNEEKDSTRRTSATSTNEYEAPVPRKPAANVSSLFGNNYSSNSSSVEPTIPKATSLFQQQQVPPQTDRVERPASLFGNSNNLHSEDEQLFQGQDQHQKHHTHHNQHHHHHHHQHHQHHQHQSPNPAVEELKNGAAEIPDRIKSPIFDQVNISPDLRPRVKPKRNNILNNFSMTSLAQHEESEKTKSINGRDKKMFFIESSPSPTESVGQYIDNKLQQSKDAALQQSDFVPPPPPPPPPTSNTIVDQQQPLKDGEAHLENVPLEKSNSKSLFAGSNAEPAKQIDLDFSSDDSSISDESDWSSMSDGEGSDVDDPHEVNAQWNRTVFKRGEPPPKPAIKRSLLSGLFLNEMQTETEKPQYPQPHFRDPVHQDQPGVLSSSSSSLNFLAKHPMRKADGSAFRAPNDLHHNTAMVSTSHVNVSGLVSEPHHDHLKSFNDNIIEGRSGAGTGSGSAVADDQLSSSLSSVLSKSAFNLTNYFSKQRKNSFSSIVSDRTRTKYAHESRAPPTASTLLPTALATHMFLPNAHQKARSRLAAVVEASSLSNETTRKNSANIDSDDLNVLITEEQAKKSHPPTPKAIPRHQSLISIDDEANVQNKNNNFNISRKLSPKTTRRQMLATELSDSMRKSILWDRKNLYKTTGPSTESVDNTNTEKVYDSEINETPEDGSDGDNGNYPVVGGDEENTTVNNKSNRSSVGEKRPNSATGNGKEETSVRLKYSGGGPDWEDETDFHTRGW
ncbi:hypothetical protein WICPIJ_007140 [Wickerhamomyces pijperi]|uniref:Nitrogen regulatory protein areA GATA-like domain-containing protein n=1 Tax=Wickerhamomyces pijperi TaxID=599730 RepID=A0A9P8Q0S5_WICPI|nr:hypothetical protein WICPIJ_007140 [Wickerhamomyces pijperi]